MLLNDTILYDLASYIMMPCDVIAVDITSNCSTYSHIMSYDVISHDIIIVALYNTLLHSIIRYDVISCHTISHRMISSDIMS